MEEFCLKHVGEASLDFLVAVTEEYQLQVAADKKHVLKVVLRHLTSEDVEKSADQGVFETVQRIRRGIKESGCQVEGGGGAGSP